MQQETSLKIEFVKEPGETFTLDEVEKLMQWSFNAARKTVFKPYQQLNVCKYDKFRDFFPVVKNRIYLSQDNTTM